VASLSRNPHASLSDDEKREKRKKVFVDVVKKEEALLAHLEDFARYFATPLLVRDTPFKREFLSNSAVALSLNHLKDIAAASQEFLDGLKSSDSPSSLATAYLYLAPALQVFGSYAMENAACLNAVKAVGRQLREFSTQMGVPRGTLMETYLLMPLQHYVHYCAFFQVRALSQSCSVTQPTKPYVHSHGHSNTQNVWPRCRQEFVWLTPGVDGATEEARALLEALDAVVCQTDYVDEMLIEIVDSINCLALQEQCET